MWLLSGQIQRKGQIPGRNRIATTVTSLLIMFDLLSVRWAARSGQGSSDQSPAPSPLCAHSDRGSCKRCSAQLGIVASGKRQ